MAVPDFSFRNDPPVSRFPETGSPALRQRYRRTLQDSFEESRYAIRGWNEYLARYREQKIVTSNGSFRVLVQAGSSDTASDVGFTPWYCQKLPLRTVRVFPAATWDGLGDRVEASYAGIIVPPEGSVDIVLPATANGYIYVECTVDDGDPYHGILTGVEIKTGNPNFYSRDGSIVNLPICYYVLVGDEDYSLDPVRSYVMTLRRYGPQGSLNWDVQATG